MLAAGPAYSNYRNHATLLVNAVSSFPTLRCRLLELMGHQGRVFAGRGCCMCHMGTYTYKGACFGLK